MHAPMPEIAVVDVRDGGPLQHAVERPHKARALRDDCLAWFPKPATPLVPLLDRLAQRWLSRSASPYVGEIAAIAASLGFPGVWLLNGSYQWACTTLARDEDGAPWLARTLDWPFPGLGRHVEVAHMRGTAGEFYSVTWPGYAGTLTGMAPGRFAAAINQAPLWRRTRHPWLRVADIGLNAIDTWRNVRHIPPDQLLRNVFETAASFAEAQAMLERTPVARPVIFTLAGVRPGERCIVERTLDGFTTRHNVTCTANDWLHKVERWEGRVSSEMVLTCSHQEAGNNSLKRREALHDWPGSIAAGGFAWIDVPVLNKCTRLGVEACAATGVMRVVGFEREGEANLPARVTAVREVTAA